MNKWQLQLPLFGSFSDLIENMAAYEATLKFKVPNNSFDETAEELIRALENANQTLKVYLYQLKNTPTKRNFTSEDVREAFQGISASWKQLMPEKQIQYMPVCGIKTFEDSLDNLLADESALQAARTELNISALDIVDIK